MSNEVLVMRLPMSLPCPVPVVPGTPDVFRDGAPIPLEERTEKCCVDAFWMIGAQITCDVHLRDVLPFLLDIEGGYDGLMAEGGYEPARSERLSWHERYRYAQEWNGHVENAKRKG